MGRAQKLREATCVEDECDAHRRFDRHALRRTGH
jgi:hypothetical protein